MHTQQHIFVRFDRTTSGVRAGAIACAVTSAAALAGALGGCNTMNRDNGLIGAEPGALPDLRGDTSPAERQRDGSPSLRGLDRRHWEPVVILIPSGQVEHQPTYFEPLLLASGPARNDALPPTTDTVLEGASDGGSMVLETAVAPVIFAGQLVLLPIALFVDPPWTVHRAPEALEPSAAELAPTDWRWVEGP